MVGYSIVTTIDDELVYITKGSGAGGDIGGVQRAGSTWTQPNHSHNINSDTASHNHQWYDYVVTSTSKTYNSGGAAVNISYLSTEGTHIISGYGDTEANNCITLRLLDQ